MKHSLGIPARAFLGALLGLPVACAPHAPPAPPAGLAPHPLQGFWEASGDSGPVTMTITGDSLYFHRGPDFQYDTTFTLVPDSEPLELHATILDSPRTTDSAGELVVAIYEFAEGRLNIAVVGKEKSFERAIDRYTFTRVPPRK